ncbi:hypothetical protein [uncultured Gammaproteobacteria bacterium]|nr:hypothetical protein [uncultured Gammaproteobacteria bacterium]
MSDFSIYIELYNDTHSTLKFKSKTATRGGWISMPPLTIAPFKNVSFFMEKLSSDVPSGSEGTVTYQVAVPDTNEEGDNSTTDVTFTAKFCDPYFGNNYCQFNTSHPKLFSIYFQAKTDNGNWNKNYCPKSGHPVYLRLFIKEIS